jgi:hypothetical protein
MKIILAVVLCFIAQNVFAYDQEENYEDYDSIVGDLSSRTSNNNNGDILNLDAMKLHAGFGFTNTLIDLRSTPNGPSKITLQGFQLSMGLDLFSPNVITEVGLINYNSETKDSYTYDMKEFDIKTYYRYHLNRIIALRGGIGLGIRDMDVDSPAGSASYTDPVSQILLGGEAKLGRSLSFLSELSYKNSLTGGTPERGAMDLIFRVDGHF